MTKFNIGDLVVLKSGSMRMCVEKCTDESVSTIWCNEGVIGRDSFNPVLLNKWEVRDDDRSAPRSGPPPRSADRSGERGGDRGGDRGGKPPYRGGGDKDRGSDRGGDDRPPRKTGWDGKPREKKYFRKDD